MVNQKFQEAYEAAEIIRQYVKKEKVIDDWFGDEAAEVTRCALVLKEYTEDPSNGPIPEFLEESRWAMNMAHVIYYSQSLS